MSDIAFQHGENRMTICRACGAWFVWPPPSPSDIEAHLGEHRSGMPAQLRQWREETAQTRWYEHLARGMAARAGEEVQRVVDVGAGAMELTHSLARAFPNAEIEAWDMFADGIPTNLPDRITARRVDLNRLTEVRGSFDVIACVAVIEHVLDPIALLRCLKAITAPEGVAFVVGPEVTSMAHRILRKRWPYYVPDEHLSIPSMTSVRRAMAIAGVHDYELQRVNVHYSMKYLLRFLRVPLPFPRLLDFLLPIPAGAFEATWTRPFPPSS
jgi:SAM-dependent methyltransferase